MKSYHKQFDNWITAIEYYNLLAAIGVKPVITRAKSDLWFVCSLDEHIKLTGMKQ